MEQKETKTLSWQNRLFYGIIILMIYQMSLYTITNLSCTYKSVFINQALVNDKFCQTASDDVKLAVNEYLTLILALLSKAPEGIIKSRDTSPRPIFKKKEDETV